MPTLSVGPIANRREAPPVVGRPPRALFLLQDRAVTEGSGFPNCAQDRPLRSRLGMLPEARPNRGREGTIANSHASESGVTLLEMLIVMVIIAVIAAVSYPTASAGLDSLRLRSAADKVVALLNLALDRADRVQQVVEIRVSPGENAISARSMDLSLNRTLALEVPIRIASVSALPPGESPAGDATSAVSVDAQRRFLLYPGGTPPRITIELESKEGHKRHVTIDPVTGMLHSEMGP
jgi:prepilin-type N-terminal cleavage/methylation domain-containing protein